MNTMLRRSPARFLRFFDGVTDDHVHRPNVEAKYANGMLAVRIPRRVPRCPEQSKSRLPDESATAGAVSAPTGPRPGLRPQPARRTMMLENKTRLSAHSLAGHAGSGSRHSRQGDDSAQVAGELQIVLRRSSGWG